MFTGIVQGSYPVHAIEKKTGLHALWIQLDEERVEGLLPGASVSINGVCLSVVEIEGDRVRFDAIQETLNVTNLGQLEVGQLVNVERSVKFGDEIGGHVVSGHIDGQAKLIEIERPENNVVLHLQVSAVLAKYVFSKGFIGIDGCSLTVVNADRTTGTFQVWLIPETLRITYFPGLKVGANLNIEIDRQTQTIVETVERVLADRV